MASALNNGCSDATTGGGRCETDRVSALELQSNRRMLYFSDGIMEELSTDSDDSDDASPPDVPDKSYDVQLEVSSLIRIHASIS